MSIFDKHDKYFYESLSNVFVRQDIFGEEWAELILDEIKNSENEATKYIKLTTNEKDKKYMQNLLDNLHKGNSRHQTDIMRKIHAVLKI